MGRPSGFPATVTLLREIAPGKSFALQEDGELKMAAYRTPGLRGKAMQAFQVKILRDLYPKDLETSAGPLPEQSQPVFQLVRRVPALRHIAGWFIGYGIRAEHIRPVSA
jgi:hypothetical protein